MTARTAWRLAWRRAREAVVDDEPPSIADAYAWAAWLMVWARQADPPFSRKLSPQRVLIPADGRPWRLP